MTAVTPIHGLPRVGGLATMPSRIDTLRLVIAATIGQLDRLHLYLDGHQSVPEFANDPRILVHRAADGLRLRSSGKFLGMTYEQRPCVYVTLDDDIQYPPDYVAKLVAGLARFDGRVVAGFHGTLLINEQKFSKGQDVCHFSARLANDIRVDLLGTGTTAVASSQLPLDPRTWPHHDVDDLMVAIAAERRGMPRVAIARPARYLQAYAEDQPDSLWLEAHKDDTRQTALMRRLLKLERRSRLGLPPRR